MYGPLPQYARSDDDPEYKKIPPGTLHEYRQLPLTEPIYLPEIAENRKCTDIAFIILFVIFIIILIAFSVFIFKRHEEPSVYLRSGKTNGHIDLKFILTIVGMILTAIVLCYLLFLSFRYNTKCTFYTLFIIEIVFTALCTILLWVLAVMYQNIGIVIGAAMNTLMLIGLAILIYCVRKKLPLIIAIYEEAFQAIFSVKALLVAPLLTIFVLIVANLPLGFAIAKVFMDESRGLDGIVYAYCVVLVFATLWLLTFIIGSQCIVVAGAVSGYYFARDKSNLGSPFCTSMCVYIRFHLGTVAAGSLIITILTMIKNAAQKAARDNDSGLAAVLIGCCMDCLIEIVEYLTKKAYIMTAIHGKSLCTSGKRAARLLWSNLLDTIAVDFVGGLALAGAVLLMLLIIVLVGLGINYSQLQDYNNLNWLWSFSLGMYGGLFIVIFFLDLLMVTIETVFLCFCEDKILNNGSRDRPYFMSPRLLQTMQRIFGIVDSRRNSLANPPPPPPPPGYYQGQYPNQYRR